MVEDNATGSAMRLLVDYWHQRTGATRFSAFQCSPVGGVLLGNLNGNFVEVGGSVEAAIKTQKRVIDG